MTLSLKLYLFLLLGLFTVAEPTAGVAQEARVSKWPRGVTYEIFVQAFADSDNDGIGDIRGMTARLDYLKALGVEGVWLMPINPSPSYHKYDVTNYYDIHPDYGTLDDFKTFIREAHKRNIKVVMDLVLNHSSSQHPWFLEAKAKKDSPYRNYFVWAHKDDPQVQTKGKIIAGDSDNVNRWNKLDDSDYLYYSYFGGGMPDLNYDNPDLREEVFKIGRFWMSEVGVDGFRLDAARHIFPDDRAKDNHRWWVYFRNEMQKVNKEVYLVGEVWAPAEVVGPYMQGLPALFNFDMGGAIINAVNSARADSLVFKHRKIRSFYQSVNPAYVDATFLTNHDQNRIMSSVNNNIDKAKMAAALLLTLPGSPYLYYGEELGMRGKKPDEYIREPFLWDVAMKDKVRSKWISPRYSTDSTVVPASRQMADKSSLYNHYKALIQLRNNSQALSYGEVEALETGYPEVCAFVRMTEQESVLVLHNLSSQEKTVQLPSTYSVYSKVEFKNKKASVRNRLVQLPAYSSLVLSR
ncbi:alpha-amylase family glycosyl hydrolase [Pedobacter sp. SYSU D00535]|uniref:alpha-amylase family glycosyl hydrolase n=1 Tax=Pedobacter sp. SYSU D00535 TaxID=2810308 RepID=UPI001A96E0B5|nr:alpha-amylase family glycosyl hydrolase [Pedobacter sp. SYSU D00535]